MADKFTTLITLLIIALVAFYAFQNYYKPTAGQLGSSIENNSISNRSVGLQTYSRSWPIPGTNLTFQHNISFANGRRVDFVGYQATGAVNIEDLVNRSILVIVPKELAANASAVRITPNRGVIVLKDDPAYFLPKPESAVCDGRYVSPEEFHSGDLTCDNLEVTNYALEFTQWYGRGCSSDPGIDPTLELCNVLSVPMPSDIPMSFIVGERTWTPSGPGREVFFALAKYSDRFDELSPEEFPVLIEHIIAILNDQSTPVEQRIAALDSFIPRFLAYSGSGGFEVVEEQQVQETPRELVLQVSEFSPKARESFSLPRNDRAVGEPVVAVRGLASSYRITADVVGSVVTVDVDLSDIDYGGGLFYFDQIQGYVELFYPQSGYRFSIPLTVQVNHVRDATIFSPRALPGGVGGEFMFIVPNLQRPIEQVVFQGDREICGLDQIIDIPAADPANPKAVVLWIPHEVKNALIQHGECYFVDQRGGVVPNSQITLSTTLTRSNELESLMPFVANLDALQPGQRWNECSEGYCSCTAARQALESAIAKTKADARRFYGPGYTLYQNKFWRFYLFNLAAVEGCNFGNVPLQGAAPGEIQVVAIGVNPANLNQVIAKSFHGPDSIQPISMVQDVTGEEIKQAVLSPWLCFDPNGLPQSLPEASCSAEQRGEQIASR